MKDPSQLLKFTQVCMQLATEQVPLIRHREFKPYEKGANARMDQKVYHRRNPVETVISVLKRKYGSAVRSRV